MTKTKQEKTYVVIGMDDCASSRKMIEKEVVEYYNSLIKGMNEECMNDNEKMEIAKNFEEAKKNFPIFCEQVIELTENNPVLILLSRAINNNSSWNGQTKLVNGIGYYRFCVKPLYFNDEEESVFIQIRADKMCPSGYSDNGIKYIEQYEISKHAFKQPKKLVEYLLNNVLRHKTTPEERKIQYIEF